MSTVIEIGSDGAIVSNGPVQAQQEVVLQGAASAGSASAGCDVVSRATSGTDMAKIAFPHNGSGGGDIGLSTRTDAGSVTEKMRVTASGALGIVSGQKIYLDGVACSGDTNISEGPADQIVINAGGRKWDLTPDFFGSTGFATNGVRGMAIENTSTGNAGEAQFYAQNSLGSAVLGMAGTGRTTSGLKVANTLYLFGDTAGGMNIGAVHGAGAINFFSGGTTLQGKFAANGDFYTNDGTVHSLSDARYKERVGEFSAGIAELREIAPSLAVWRHSAGVDDIPTSEMPFVGVVAQDVQNWIPEAVKAQPDGKLTMAAQPVFWAGVRAIVQLDDQQRVLTEQVRNLEAKIAALEARLTTF